MDALGRSAHRVCTTTNSIRQIAKPPNPNGSAAGEYFVAMGASDGRASIWKTNIGPDRIAAAHVVDLVVGWDGAVAVTLG